MTQLSIYFYIKLISTLSKQPKIIPEERSTSPTKTRYSPLIFHVQTPIIILLQIDGKTEAWNLEEASLINFPQTYLSIFQDRNRYACMQNCEIASDRSPSYIPPRFPFPFFSLSFLSFLLFFSFRSTVMAPRLPLGWPARNTPGGFVTGGWPGSCGLAEPALTFYGYHATTARAKSKSHSR